MTTNLCKICKKPFPAKRDGHVICSNPECRKENRRRNSTAWAMKNKAPQSYPDFRFCPICYNLFPVSSWRHTICSDKCRKVRATAYNKQYKIDHIERIKPKKKVQPEYELRETPQPKQYPCRTCGKINNNRFHCKSCLSVLMRDISQEYPGFLIKDGGAEDMDAPGV